MSILTNVALLYFLRRKVGRRWLPVQLLRREQGWLYAALPILAVATVLVLSPLDYLHLPNWGEKSFKELMPAPAGGFLFMCLGALVLEELLWRIQQTTTLPPAAPAEVEEAPAPEALVAG
ncbi:hypothetical protein LJY25_15110 [Hymenobacter sp. BT175]|uniref:hypothetical protein n=1 Tax=Hymenobacter translucens TaxID=2886507 RepID=UPI001D0DF36D|nr:hypothetical protein [Hymenobacter translucens]MCC2547780.1 hypothetical protein [Hymenobacter translucens]